MKSKILLFVLALSCLVLNGCKEEAAKEVKYTLDKESALGYNICDNLRFGYSYCYPVFLEPQGEDIYDSSRTVFMSKDGKIKVVASARINHSDRSDKSIMEEEKYFLEHIGCRITYKFFKNGMIVFTGFTPDEKIFYTKIAVCELFSPLYNGPRNVIARVNVEFAEDDRHRGEDITELLKKFPYNKNRQKIDKKNKTNQADL